MALQTKQIADLNALNEKIAGGYTPLPQDTENLNYAKTQGYNYTPLPQGSPQITTPVGLNGLNESQLYRSGTNIYKLPDSMPSSKITGVTPTITPITPEPTDVNSLMAGVKTGNDGLKAQLDALNATLPEQNKVTDLQNKSAAYSEANKTANTDLLNSTLNKYGLQNNVDQINKLMPQIASTTAAFDNYSTGLEGRTASASSIYGRQALAQRQKAVEVAGLSAAAQAYQGNVDMARNIASDAVNAQYKDQENYITSLNNQITNSYTDLNTADKKRADELLLVNNERLKNIETEKTKKNDISNVMIVAAKNGADSTTLKNIMSSTDVNQALINAGDFYKDQAVKGTWTESANLDSSGNPLLFNSTTGEYKNSKGDIVSVTGDNGKTITSPSGISYDWSTYNAVGTPSEQQAYVKSVQDSINNVGKLNNYSDLATFINKYMPNSKITPIDIINMSDKSGVGWEEVLGLIQKEAPGGDSPVALKNNNFGGITWTPTYQATHPNVTKGSARPASEGGNYVKFATVEDGLMAEAQQFSKRKVETPTTTNNGNLAPGTTGSAQINTTVPGYSTEIIKNTGGLTQSLLDKAAINYAMTGSLPTGARASTGAGMAQQTAIKNRGAELDATGQISANKAKLQALTTSLGQQTTYQNTIERSVNTVDENIKILQDTIKKVNSSDSPVVNDLTNAVKGKYLGSGDLAAFKSAIQTVRTEYGFILARGGQVTEGTRNEAENLIPDNITKDQLQQVLDVLETEGKNVRTQAQGQVDDVSTQINNIIGGGNLYNGGTGNDSSDPLVTADNPLGLKLN